MREIEKEIMNKKEEGTPQVSVIIPVRNGKEFIYECLDSILNQDINSVEVLVIDDGSSDFDYDTLKEYSHKIRVYHLPGNGVSSARNAGLRLSNGEYIAFLDVDDVWFPGKLTAQIKYLAKNPSVGCVFGGYKKWYVETDKKFPSAKLLTTDCSTITDANLEHSGWIYTRLLSGLLIQPSTAMIRREVYEQQGGFDESLRIGEDLLFWLKVSRMFEMHALSGFVTLYRIHAESAMNQVHMQNHQEQVLRIAVQRWGLKNGDGQILSTAVLESYISKSMFSHGYQHFWHGSSRVAQYSFYKALRGGVKPFRSTIYLILSFFKRIYN